jgi:hypothetical protein
MFSGSPVMKEKFEELAKVTERYTVAFQPLNRVRGLSRHFEASALIRNYDVLTDYCTERVNKCNDPINK